MANVVFERLYPKDYTSTVSTRVSNSLLVGAIIGQLFIGLVCDRIGRTVALVFTTLLIVLGATLGTAAHGAHGSAKGLFWFLTFSRGLTGIGVGGEYPAASTSASEAANEQMLSKRGPVFVMVTNFVLTLGGPLASSIFLIVLSIVGENHLSTVWRICFGFGILLPLVVLVLRLRMLSSKLYREGAIKSEHRKGATITWFLSVTGGHSLVQAGAWFIFDFVAFPNGIFSGTIISSVIHNGDIKKIAEWQLLLSSITLPGVVIGALLCNPLGRRNTGPGDMVLLVSAESYATPIRGTCYGISAAIGKAGAALGVQVFTPIQRHLGTRWTFIIAAICGFAGVLVTYFFVPDMTRVDLADEDARFIEYLDSNGWEGVVGEEVNTDLVERESSSGLATNRVLKA
ncbi:MFS Git1p-like glycerophosphoinositol permease [Lactarius indigo]|nr:MFS Git1p-like glycerophosphoinositol permease [Lactarius indigo]